MKTKTPKIICYHHDDMDGITAAAIIRKVYSSTTEIEFIEVKYNDNTELTLDADKCIIVDFSFPKDKMLELYNHYHNSLLWFDHHKTTIDIEKELPMIKGVRDNSMSGCMIVWKNYFPGGLVPEAVVLADDYDMWTFKHPKTKSYAEVFSLYVKSPTDDIWTFLLDPLNEKYLPVCHTGANLLKAKTIRVEKSFKDGTDIVFEQHKTRAINTNHDVSAMGEYCYKIKGYAVAMIYSVRENKVIVGLRSNTVDVGDIAKGYGGGGHKFAAGFTISPSEFFSKIFKEKVMK